MEKDLIEFIAKSLVDDPSAVSVNETEGEKGMVLQLKVADGDIGKVKPVTGKVVAVGDGIIDANGNKVPVPVKVGDKVLYGKFGGTEVTVDGEELLILRAEDIYAVFK